MRGIGYAKDKKAEIAEKNRVAIEVTKAAYISKKATLEKYTVEKLEAIEDYGNRVEAVVNITWCPHQGGKRWAPESPALEA